MKTIGLYIQVTDQSVFFKNTFLLEELIGFSNGKSVFYDSKCGKVRLRMLSSAHPDIGLNDIYLRGSSEEHHDRVCSISILDIERRGATKEGYIRAILRCAVGFEESALRYVENKENLCEVDSVLVVGKEKIPLNDANIKGIIKLLGS